MSRRAATHSALWAALLLLGCQGRARDASAKDDVQRDAPAAVAAPPVAPPTEAQVAVAPTPGAPPEVIPAAAPAEPPTAPPAPLWRVKDNKVRCVRAPCPTLDALPVDSSAEKVQVAELDLSPLGLSPRDTQRLMAEVYAKGLLVRGQVETRSDPRGKPYAVLRATALPSR